MFYPMTKNKKHMPAIPPANPAEIEIKNIDNLFISSPCFFLKNMGILAFHCNA
jgi:hypothetical protein